MDFRVVAATNEDPFELLRQGRIKPDLFYRLAVVYIRLPKLIERENDIELLTNYFIDYFNLKTDRRIQHPGAQIREIFQNYTWPGNVRELRNVVEGFFACGKQSAESGGYSCLYPGECAKLPEKGLPTAEPDCGPCAAGTRDYLYCL